MQGAVSGNGGRLSYESEASCMEEFRGLQVLGKSPISQSEAGLMLYKELWNKLSWALGSAYNRPYRGSTEIRGLARRLALVVLANEDILLEKERQTEFSQ